MQQPSLAIDIHIYRKGNVVNHRYWDVRSTGKLVTPLVVAAKLSAEWFCPNCLLDLTQIVYDRRSQYLLCPRCGTGLPWQHTTLQIEPQCVLCTGDCLLGHRHKLDFQADKRPNPLRFTHDVGLSDKRVAHYVKEEQKLQEELKASFAKLCFMRDRLQPRDVQEGGMHFHIGLNIKVGNHFFSFEQQLQNMTPKGVGCSTNCGSHAVPGCDSFHLPSILLGDDQRITSKVVAFRSLSIQEDKATLVVFPGLISPALLCTARGMKIGHHSRSSSSSSSPRTSLGLPNGGMSSSSHLHSPTDPGKPDPVLDMARGIISKASGFTDNEKTRLVHALIDGFHLNDIFCQSSYQTYTETGWDTGDDSFCTDPFASELDNSEIDSSMEDPDSSSSTTLSTNKSSKTSSDIKPLGSFPSSSSSSSSSSAAPGGPQTHHPFSAMLSNTLMNANNGSSNSNSNSNSNVANPLSSASHGHSSSSSSSTNSSLPSTLASSGGLLPSNNSNNNGLPFGQHSPGSLQQFQHLQQQHHHQQQQHQQQHLHQQQQMQHMQSMQQPQGLQMQHMGGGGGAGAGAGGGFSSQHSMQQPQQQQQQSSHGFFMPQFGSGMGPSGMGMDQLNPINLGPMGSLNNPANNNNSTSNNNNNNGNPNNSGSNLNPLLGPHGNPMNPMNPSFDPFHRGNFS